MQRELLVTGYAILAIPVAAMAIARMKPMNREALLVALFRSMDIFTMLPWPQGHPAVEGVWVDDEDNDY